VSPEKPQQEFVPSQTDVPGVVIIELTPLAWASQILARLPRDPGILPTIALPARLVLVWHRVRRK
jgi:hypothetical protein